MPRNSSISSEMTDRLPKTVWMWLGAEDMGNFTMGARSGLNFGDMAMDYGNGIELVTT